LPQPKTSPLISCVMPTMNNRYDLTHQAIKYFLRQDYPQKEIVIVDDEPGSPAEFAKYPGNVRYFVRPGKKATIGAKANFAIERAKGDILHRQDDDDWYHPRLLSELWEMAAVDPVKTVTRLYEFSVFLLLPWKYKICGERPWLLGTSIMFHRKFWEPNHFREDIPDSEDFYFRKGGAQREAILRRKDACVVLRHGLSHGWTRMYGGQMVDDYFAKLADYPVPIDKVLPAEDLEFYRKLREKILASKS